MCRVKKSKLNEAQAKLIILYDPKYFNHLLQNVVRLTTFGVFLFNNLFIVGEEK